MLQRMLAIPVNDRYLGSAEIRADAGTLVRLTD